MILTGNGFIIETVIIEQHEKSDTTYNYNN